jgi:serine phosphatase RsbU (regulator of sigma subunit)
MPVPQQTFFRSIPRSDLLFITGAFFLLFAPLWAVMMADIVAIGRTPGFLIWCILAGLTGACWFLGMSYRRVFLIPAILLNLFVVFGGFYFETRASNTGGWFGPGTAAPVPTFEGAIMLAMLIGAFVLILRFLRRVATPHMRMRAELGVASDIHAALVRPIDRTIETPTGPLTIAARSDASSTMGGDLIDLIEHPGAIDLVLADVTGHGVRAGVVMALAKGVIHAHLRPETPLADAVARINADLARLTTTDMFVTAVFVRIPIADPASAEAVVAGHPPLIRLCPHAAPARIDSTGLPLGIDATAEYAAVPLALTPGDRLALYSDGLTEARLADGSEFGTPALERLLQSTASQTPVAQLAAVLTTIPNHPNQPADDRTLAILTISN